MLVVVSVLTAAAWSAPAVVWYAVLTIGVGSAFIGAYWEVLRMIMEQDGLGERARRPIDESRYWTETVSSLLRNKRLRQITGSSGRGAWKKRASAGP